MSSCKSAAALLIALLILVPTLVRAHQKLERPATAKPAASFRDVDRPPELNLTAAPQRCVTLFTVHPLFKPLYRLVADPPCLPDAPRGSRAGILRAPPAVV